MKIQEPKPSNFTIINTLSWQAPKNNITLKNTKISNQEEVHDIEKEINLVRISMYILKPIIV